MSSNRYQLWMRLRCHHPGYALREGVASFAWRILDLQSPDYQAKKSEAVEYGYVLAGSSDDCSDIPSMQQRPGQQIEQALAVLKQAARYDCDLSAKNEIVYLESPLGAVTDSVDVDQAIQILEGQQ